VCAHACMYIGEILNNNDLKSCNKCLEHKPYSAFPFRNKLLLKRRGTCLDCMKKNVSYRYKELKKNAKQRGIQMQLSKDEFILISSTSCYFCKGINVTLGIDRFDNKLGYTKENCVSCCSVCNYMKAQHTAKYFIEHISKIYNVSQQMKEDIGNEDEK
jgi:hypothetical protein